MNTWLAVLLPFYAGLVALAAFTNWMTALAFVAVIGVGCVLAIRHFDKHHGPEFDDKIGYKRQSQAIDDYVELMLEVKEKRGSLE